MEINKENIEVLKAWSKITRKRLRREIFKVSAYDTKSLLSGIDLDVIENQVKLQYNYYGMFVDMGVGRGTPLGSKSRRRPKKWYAKVIFREVAKLSEILARDFGYKMQASILTESKNIDNVTLNA